MDAFAKRCWDAQDARGKLYEVIRTGKSTPSSERLVRLISFNHCFLAAARELGKLCVVMNGDTLLTERECGELIQAIEAQMEKRQRDEEREGRIDWRQWLDWLLEALLITRPAQA